MNSAKQSCIWVATLVLAAAIVHAQSGPVGTAFTYQGQLKQGGASIDGLADFQFSLWDNSVGGLQIGGTLGATLDLDDGVFTSDLDFGSAAINGDERWLQIAVRHPAGGGAFVTLSPRQPLMATPYAQFALSAYGPGITNLSASNISSGEIPASVLTGNYNLTGIFSGSGAGLNMLNASNLSSGLLPSDRLSGAYSNPLNLGNPANAFAGSGAGLSNLNASNITSGTLDIAHMPTNGVWNLTSALQIGDSQGFVGINRNYTVGLEWFGVHAPVNSGYGGMYVTTEGATAWPFYGYKAGTQTAWTYLDGNTGDWHINVDGNKVTVTDEGLVGIRTNSPAHPLHVVSTSTERTIHAENSISVGIGVSGRASHFSGANKGVWGSSESTSGTGVYGTNTTDGTSTYGVFGEITHATSQGIGVFGRAPYFGVVGHTTLGGAGVTGLAVTAGDGVVGEASSALHAGVRGVNTAVSGTTHGVQGVVISNSGYAGHFTGRGYFSGNVGLGTLSPANRLSVAGNADVTGQVSIGITGADARLLVRGITGEDAFRVRVEGGTKLLVKDNGGVGIGSNFGTIPADGLRVLGNVGIGVDPTEKLHVSGNIRATGSVFASCGTLSCSDLRFKTNIHPLTGALALVQMLQPVSYDWKHDEFPDRDFSMQRQTGLIAQEVREVVPEMVQQDGDGYLSVDYGRLTPLLVEAVRELRAEKDAEIDSLRSEIAELRSLVNQLAVQQKANSQ